MYVSPNYPTKKALKEAVASGASVTVFQPNNIFNTVVPTNGKATIEGPHYPKPHTWYAVVTITDGKVTAVK